MSEATTNQSEAKMLSERSFGLIFTGIFLIIGVFPLITGGSYRQWALIVAAMFAVPAILLPAILAPLNRLWVKFGLLMHTIVNPILMGLVFFIAVLPTGLILRLLGKDPMHRKFDASKQSYWINREKDSLSKESFKDQF
jgi:predicted membrane metal-binding protein